MAVPDISKAHHSTVPWQCPGGAPSAPAVPRRHGALWHPVITSGGGERAEFSQRRPRENEKNDGREATAETEKRNETRNVK